MTPEAAVAELGPLIIVDVNVGELVIWPDAPDRVPDVVIDGHRQLHPVCSKLYWRGTRWRNRVGELASTMKGS